MDLETLKAGDAAEVAPLNNNFQYLDGRATTNADAIATNRGYITTLQSNMSTALTNISELQTDMSTVKTFQAAPVNTLTDTEITLTDNSYNQITISGNTEFTLPDVSDTTTHQIEVNIKMPVLYTIDVGTTYYYKNSVPTFYEAGNYELIYTYDHLESEWRCGCVKVEVRA